MVSKVAHQRVWHFGGIFEAHATEETVLPKLRFAYAAAATSGAMFGAQASARRDYQNHRPGDGSVLLRLPSIWVAGMFGSTL